MKMMVWKELRENLKWAILGLLGLSLAEFYGLMTRSSDYENRDATLCNATFLMASAFGCAALGIVLGLIQNLPELRRDRWASLLFRPVPRTTIYSGKVLAGLLLYVLATVPPFLACVWYTATPGHFAVPFLIQMTLPGIANIFAGAMFYFAALFVGLKRGAWFGSRAVGFLAVFIGMVFVTGISFLVALSVAIFTGLIFFAAGWGSILSNGRLSDQPWLSRFSLITAVFFGTCFLMVLACSLFFMFADQGYNYWGDYRVTLEGKPLKYAYTKEGTVITDLTGNVIHDKQLTTSSNREHFLSFVNVSGYIGKAPEFTETQRGNEYGYRNNQTYVMPASGSKDNTENWYYLPLERKFVGYSGRSRLRIGSIGQNGFKPDDQATTPLPEYQPGYETSDVSEFTQFGPTVYHSDFDQRKLTPIFTGADGAIYGVTPMQSSDRNNDLDWAAIALLDKMLILDASGHVIATLPYHQDVSRWGSLAIAVMPGNDRFFVQYMPTQGMDDEERAKMPYYFEEVDAKGAVLNAYVLPQIKIDRSGQRWQVIAMESVVPPIILYGYLAYEKVGALCGSKQLAHDLQQTLKAGPDNFISNLIRVSLASIACAILSVIWLRRVHIPRNRIWAWGLFVLGFNLPGLITMRLVADWPVRVKCPQCGKKRRVEETVCPHCQALWPVEKPTGIEIFEAKEAAVERVS